MAAHTALNSLATGPIVQTCWVVKDIAATEDYLTRGFGAGRWTRMPGIHFGEGCFNGDEPADFVVDVSLSYQHDMMLELIAPVSGRSIYQDFLDRTGGGQHHIAFEPDDYDASLAAARQAGLGIAAHGTMGGLIDFAYVDGGHAGVPYIELLKFTPTMREIWADVKKRSGYATEGSK